MSFLTHTNAHTEMSVKQDYSEDEEDNHGPEVLLVETNRFGFIIGNGETDRSVLISIHTD